MRKTMSYSTSRSDLLIMRMLLLDLLLLVITTQRSSGQFADWCIADEQVPDDVLQEALNWACAENRADCSKIRENQPCFLPNTVRDHASYAFNDYYQKLKHKGATCYFNSAAFITAVDPSHDSCKFEYLR